MVSLCGVESVLQVLSALFWGKEREGGKHNSPLSWDKAEATML